MTRNDTITTLTTSTNRADIVAALKAADAYSGKNEDGVYICRMNKAAIVAHARTVGAAMVAADKADAKPAAKKVTFEDRTATAIKRYTRTPRVSTIRKMATAIDNVSPDADGVITLTAIDLALGGIGKAWASKSNDLLSDPRYVHAQVLATCGYTGRTTRGTLVLTPIATEAAEQAS